MLLALVALAAASSAAAAVVSPFESDDGTFSVEVDLVAANDYWGFSSIYTGDAAQSGSAGLLVDVTKASSSPGQLLRLKASCWAVA